MQIDGRLYPDFFIAGFQKCGSSSLAQWLDIHPDIVCSIPKEPKYFSDTARVNQKSGYRALVPGRYNEGQLLFDASQIYAVDPVTVENIQRVYADVPPKFIFVAKDPVARAISAYYHTIKHGTERRPIKKVFTEDFLTAEDIAVLEHAKVEQAAKAGKVCSKKYSVHYSDGLMPYCYLTGSFYRRHITKYIEAFGEDNVLVVPLSIFNTSPHDAFNLMCTFLNLAPFESYPNTSQRFNQTKIPFYRLAGGGVIPGMKPIWRLSHAMSSRIGLGGLFMRKPPEAPTAVRDILESVLAEEKEWFNGLVAEYAVEEIHERHA